MASPLLLDSSLISGRTQIYMIQNIWQQENTNKHAGPINNLSTLDTITFESIRNSCFFRRGANICTDPINRIIIVVKPAGNQFFDNLLI